MDTRYDCFMHGCPGQHSGARFTVIRERWSGLIWRGFLAGVGAVFFVGSLSGCGGSEEGLPEISAPPALYASDHIVSTQTVVMAPVCRDDGIYFGDKGVQIKSTGEGAILCAGKELALGIFAFKRSAAENLIPALAGNLENVQRVQDATNRLFVFSGEFALPGSTNRGGYAQELRLLPDNRLQFRAQLSVPEALKTNGVSGVYLLKIPLAVCAAREFAVDGVKGLFPAADEAWPAAPRVLSATAAQRFAFASGEADAFTITFVRGRMLVVRTNGSSSTGEGRMVYLELQPAADGTVELALDLSPVSRSSLQASTDFHNGIDFWKSDRLHVPNYGLNRNLIQNPSFEAGLRYYRFYDHGYYTKCPYESLYESDSSNAMFGGKSVLIHALGIVSNMPCGLGTFAIPLVPNRTYTLSCYAKGDKPKKLRLTASAYTAFFPLILHLKPWDLTPEWRRYSATFTAPNAGVNIVLRGHNYNKGDDSDGRIWVDGLQLEEGPLTDFVQKPLIAELITAEADNFFKPGQRLDARLHIAGQPGVRGRATVSLRDFFDRELWSAQFSFRLDARGCADIALPLEGKLPAGVFVIRADFETAGGIKDSDYFRLTIMEFLDGKHRNKDLTANGLPDNWPRSPAVLKRARQIGIGGRCYICSDISEEEMSRLRQYDLDFLGTAIMSDADNGSVCVNGEVLVSQILKLTNVTAELEKTIEDASYRRAQSEPWINMWWFCGETEARYASVGVPGKALVPHNMPDYARIMKACYRGVKRFDPTIKVLADGGPCNMNPQGGINFLEGYVAALGTNITFDGIGIHPYRALPEDPDMDDDTATLLGVLAKRGWGNVPVYWNEGIFHENYIIPSWGTSTHRGASTIPFRMGAVSYHMGWGERMLAAYYAHYWLVGLKYQDRIKCFDGHSPKIFALDTQLTPFAFQKIPNTLGRLLGNASFKSDIRFAPGMRAYVFEDEASRPVAALWSYIPEVDRGERPCPIAEIKFAGALPQVFDLMEVEHKLVAGRDGTCRVPVSSFPVFIRGAPGTLADLCDALNYARLFGSAASPLRITADPENGSRVAIQFRNLLSRPYEGEARVGMAGKQTVAPLALAAQAVCKIEVPLPEALSADRIVAVNLPLELRSKDGIAVNTNITFRAFMVRKRGSRSIAIDGVLDDWEGIAPISITNQFNQNEVTTAREALGYAGDFAARFRMVWDEATIYLAVEVVDDKLVFEKGGSVHNWNNDSLQVYFDTFCNARAKLSRGFDSDDYSYDFCRDPKDMAKATPFRMFTPEEQLTGGIYGLQNRVMETNIPTAFRETKDGYRYEIAFPKRYLAPMVLKTGAVAGFGLFLNDHDGLKIKNALTLTPEGTVCYMRPDLYPVIVLGE